MNPRSNRVIFPINGPAIIIPTPKNMTSLPQVHVLLSLFISLVVVGLPALLGEVSVGIGFPT